MTRRGLRGDLRIRSENKATVLKICFLPLLVPSRITLWDTFTEEQMKVWHKLDQHPHFLTEKLFPSRSGAINLARTLILKILNAALAADPLSIDGRLPARSRLSFLLHRLSDILFFSPESPELSLILTIDGHFWPFI